MIRNLKPYSTMKDSGVPWLGQVPKHWSVSALRHRYAQCLGKMLDSQRITGEHLVPYLRNVDVQWGRVNITKLPQMDIAPHEYGRYTLMPGDLLVCEGGEVGRCAIWAHRMRVCGFQKALHRLRPLSAADDPRFLYYSLRVAADAAAFTDGHESTIAHLTGDKLRAHRFAFPPRDEQGAAVRFLDFLDRRITRYIRAKQKLIKLLEEQKQVTIHCAVTRGLAPNVPLKRSGVEWLGDVPAHWDVKRVNSLFQERNEKGQPGLPILMVSIAAGVTRGSDSGEDGRRKRLIEDRGLYKVARHGDIAYNMMRMWQGAVGAAPEDGLVSPAYVVARPYFGVVSAYFTSVFRTEACRRDTVSRSRGIVDDRNRLYWDGFKDLRVPVPPSDEQRGIVEEIAVHTTATERLMNQVQREINLLREYRMRLVADVVTGKLDVRSAAADLPDNVEEQESLDHSEAVDEGGENFSEAELDAAPEEVEA